MKVLFLMEAGSKSGYGHFIIENNRVIGQKL